MRKAIILLCLVLLMSTSMFAQEYDREAAEREQKLMDEFNASLDAIESPADRIAAIRTKMKQSPDWLFMYVKKLEDVSVESAGNRKAAIDVCVEIIPSIKKDGYAFSPITSTLAMMGKDGAAYKSSFRSIFEKITVNVSEPRMKWFASHIYKNASLVKDHEFAIETIKKTLEAQEESGEDGSSRSGAGAIYADYGIVLYRAGKYAESLEVLNKAGELAEKDVLGNPQYMLSFPFEYQHYLGLALIKNGRTEEGLSQLAYAATVQHGIGALEAIKTVWAEIKGTDEGLTEYLKTKHLEFSKPIPEFSLKNVDGTTVTNSDLKGKVHLFYIWSHT